MKQNRRCIVNKAYRSKTSTCYPLLKLHTFFPPTNSLCLLKDYSSIEKWCLEAGTVEAPLHGPSPHISQRVQALPVPRKENQPHMCKQFNLLKSGITISSCWHLKGFTEKTFAHMKQRGVSFTFLGQRAMLALLRSDSVFLQVLSISK